MRARAEARGVPFIMAPEWALRVRLLSSAHDQWVPTTHGRVTQHWQQCRCWVALFRAGCSACAHAEIDSMHASHTQRSKSSRVVLALAPMCVWVWTVVVP